MIQTLLKSVIDVPLSYKILGIAAVAVFISVFSFKKGVEYHEGVVAKEIVKQLRKEYERGVASVAVTEKVVVKYVDRVVYRTKVVKEIQEKIIEIPADDTVSADFVRVHDYAVDSHANASRTVDEISPTGSEHSPTESSSEEDFAAREVAGVIVDNYSICYGWRDQLISLQEWVTQQQAIYPPIKER